MKDSRIILIGAMGAGKTSVGKRLADLLQRTFIDLDQILEKRLQNSIAQIFKNHGEAYFRSQEAVLLAELSNKPNSVLATGGGCVLAASSRQLLQQRGIICYLQVSPEQQMLRLKSATDRPLLPSQTQRLAFLKALHAERHCLYASIADIIIDTNDRTIEQLAQSLMTVHIVSNVTVT